MESWTAPGPDVFHTYWLKKPNSLHDYTNEPSASEWLTEGRTVLIQNNLQKVTVSTTYHLITYLCTTWKLLAVIIASVLFGILSGIIAAKRKRHIA